MAYLDNSATTQPCQAAIDAMVKCMTEGFYNPSSVYAPAVDAFRAVRECRETLLRAIHADNCDLYFTSGGTEANNLAIIGAVHRMRGRQVLAVSAVEHASILSAAPEALVSCMQVNNETGALLDAAKLHKTVAGRALIHVDGVQGFLRVPFEMKYADLYTLSGHKIHGPKGIGALVVRKGVRLEPRQIGGGQESGMRSGTENTPGIAGLCAAAKELIKVQSTMGRELMEKKLHLLEAFRSAVPELMVNGPEPEKAAPHIVNLSFPNVRGEVMLHALEAEGVYASTGSACSSKKLKVSGVLTAMGVRPERAEWALRFSLSPHTTVEEIDLAAKKLGAVYDLLKRFKRR